MTERLVGDIRRLHIEEGDVVLIRCTEVLSKEHAARIRQTVSEVLEGTGRKVPVMLLDKGLSLEIISAEKFKKMKLRDLIEPPPPPPDRLHSFPG